MNDAATRRLLLMSAGLLGLACFNDPAATTTMGSESSETSGDGDGDSGDGDGDSGDGDGDSGDGDGDGDPAANQAPVIELFEINGSNPPSTVEAAGAIILRAVVSDPDDNIARVEFEADGLEIATVNGAGPDLEAEWLLSGAEHNGTYTLTATAYDQEDEASAAVSLEIGVAMADGGADVEQWFYDGGLLDAVYDVAVSPDGDQVLLTGQTSTMNGSGQRIDRVMGAAWSDKLEDDSISASGAVWADGVFVVAGSLFGAMEFDSALYAYTEDGALDDSWAFEFSKPELGNPELVDLTSGVARDPESGQLYALGLYTPLSGPFAGENASYVAAVTPTGEQEWLRWPTENPGISGAPVLTELTFFDGALATVGTRSSGATSLWLGRWNEDGQLVSESSSADASQGHALAFGPEGRLYVGGGVEQNGGLRSTIIELDDDNEAVWAEVPQQGGEGVTAALAVDAWGELVSVSTEACNMALSDCELVVRKYDTEGTLMWSRTWDMETFSGPVGNLPGYDASLSIDRFGYIYVTAIAYTNNTGTDWWARKLAP